MLNFNFPLQPHQNYNITQYVWKPRSINFEEKANKLRRNGQVSLFVHLVTSKQIKNHTNKLIVDQNTRMNVQCAKLGEKISRNFATGFGNLVAKWNILVVKKKTSVYQLIERVWKHLTLGFTCIERARSGYDHEWLVRLDHQQHIFESEWLTNSQIPNQKNRTNSGVDVGVKSSRNFATARKVLVAKATMLVAVSSPMMCITTKCRPKNQHKS